jgi:uncharacterized protein involved in exopolysaccharide biosynthesis
MDNTQQKNYNFSSADLLIYIWRKRWILLTVGFITGVASIIISIMITPMFKASVIMFPATNVMISKELLVQNFSGKNVHGFGEEEQAEQLLQVLNSEPIRTRIIEKYNLMEHYEIDPEGKYPMTELFEQYKSNINFRMTEYMSVEIDVMDKDPEIAANIANNISDLVDTVYNGMIKDRAWEALRLVEREYKDAEEMLVVMQDSFDMVSSQLSNDIKTGEEPTDVVIRALSENGALYLSMINLVRSQAGIVSGLSLRYKEARLEAEQDLSYKFVVERAFPPEKKAYPNKSLIVIVSTFASLLLALIVLIVIDNIKTRVAIQKEK